MRVGPTAPKDPVMKRPFFYIMQDKEIFAAKQPNGTGVQFIYENDNRLINSAQIAGNVKDEEMLALLKTTQGFRQLVHSIGVSVTLLGGSELSGETVRFAFQMYGKTDPYQSGTTVVLDLAADGTEQVVALDEVDWSEDDKEPGQIRYEFGTSGIQAMATVRLYLRDGFAAPEAVADEAIDKQSQAYQDMIERSLMQLGNPARIQKAIQKAQKGEDVTIAYIGGSITQGAGAIPIHEKCYAYQSWKAFAESFGTQEQVHFVKAGVGGTPSELGMIRFDRDVLRDGKAEPDIVVVEFAVNDEGDETKGVCYESLARKILMLPNQPAVVLLFAVFAYDWNLQERLSVVGRQYELPMVSIMDAVTPQFGLTKEQGRVLSKNQFFYDVYHPSNAGHEIMAQCLMNLFLKARDAQAQEDKTQQLMQQAAIGAAFEAVKLIDRKDHTEIAQISCGGFTDTDADLQRVEMDDKLELVAQFPYNWHKSGTDATPFEMDITCKALVLVHKDSADLEVGKAEVYVDDKLVLTADPHVNGWVHCNPCILFQEETSAPHHIRIQMAAGDETKQFTILGFGYVTE